MEVAEEKRVWRWFCLRVGIPFGWTVRVSRGVVREPRSGGAVWQERETTRWASGRRPESVTPLCDVELRQKRPFEERVGLRLFFVGVGVEGAPLALGPIFPIILCRLHRFLSQIPKLSCTRPE